MLVIVIAHTCDSHSAHTQIAPGLEVVTVDQEGVGDSSSMNAHHSHLPGGSQMPRQALVPAVDLLSDWNPFTVPNVCKTKSPATATGVPPVQPRPDTRISTHEYCEQTLSAAKFALAKTERKLQAMTMEMECKERAYCDRLALEASAHHKLCDTLQAAEDQRSDLTCRLSAEKKESAVLRQELTARDKQLELQRRALADVQARVASQAKQLDGVREELAQEAEVRGNERRELERELSARESELEELKSQLGAYRQGTHEAAPPTDQRAKAPSTATAGVDSASTASDSVGRTMTTAMAQLAEVLAERLPVANAQTQPAESQPSDLQRMLARQSAGRDLPNFSGNPATWPVFHHMYRVSTQECGFSNHENMARLQKALSGKAK